MAGSWTVPIDTLPVYGDDSIGTYNLLIITDVVDVNQLPAVIDGRYVGITFDQMDYLTIQKFRYEEVAEQKIIYEDAYNEAVAEIQQRDTAIHVFKQLNDVQKNDIALLKLNEKRLLSDIDILMALLKKERRQKTHAWITTGVVGAVLGTIIITGK